MGCILPHAIRSTTYARNTVLSGPGCQSHLQVTHHAVPSTPNWTDHALRDTCKKIAAQERTASPRNNSMSGPVPHATLNTTQVCVWLMCRVRDAKTSYIVAGLPSMPLSVPKPAYPCDEAR